MKLPEQLEAAVKAQEELQKKRNTVVASKLDLDTERDKIAFRAHARGDQKAVERLAELEAEEGALDRQLKSIDAALRIANSDVTRLQQACLEAEEEAERARRVKEIRRLADELQAAGDGASEAMAAFVTAMNKIKSTANALQGDGALSDSQATMLPINLPISIKSELIAAGLLEPIVPRLQRSTIAQTVRNYAEGARRIARDIETPKKEAA